MKEKNMLWGAAHLYGAHKIIHSKCEALSLMYILSAVTAIVGCVLWGAVEQTISKKRRLADAEETVDEIPFQQLINIDKDTAILIDHTEYCPEETVFFRIVTQDGYSKLFKRKVCIKGINKYFTLNNRQYFVDTSKVKTMIGGL